jgi:uncharacterized membrane protein YadS
LIEKLYRLLPGVLLCVAITGVAIVLQVVEVRFVGQAYLEALVLAILIGVAVRTAWTPTSLYIPGITFSAKFLLECAVVMLGASVSIATVLALGPFLLVGIASVVAMALGVSLVTYCSVPTGGPAEIEKPVVFYWWLFPDLLALDQKAEWLERTTAKRNL